jgi:uncharacterized LabA/DUF88 family protein
MVKQGKIPVAITQKSSCYLEDVFVWHPDTITVKAYEILRASYYTSAIGDDNKISEITSTIRNLRFRQPPSSELSSTISPWVVKRERGRRDSKGVDIKLAVDVLTHCHAGNIDAVYLVTGDEDFLPIVKEVIRSGKQVYLAALSDGLSPRLRKYADEFINLDNVYFTSTSSDQS